MKILLISNSGHPFLEHCRKRVLETVTGCSSVGFISAAFFGDETLYFQKVTEALSDAPFKMLHVQTYNQPLQTLAKCDALLVGGGNTYRLLKHVSEANLLPEIKKRIQAGMPYVGWSAGSNIAGPTILTTNDWNVVGFNKFEGIGLVPFNINPHYKEADPTMAQFSETRDERIAEYHKANSNSVLGIEEQTMIEVQNQSIRVLGKGRVRRFERDQKPVDYLNNDTIQL